MGDAFPTDVKELIAQNIHSVVQLEVLLLLRAEPERQWSADEVAKILYIQGPMAKDMLADLARRGYVQHADACFRYQPLNTTVGSIIERLAQLYRERRVAVTNEIYSKPESVIKAFADAFRLREGE